MAIDPDSLRERQRYDAHMRESKMASLRAEAEIDRLTAAIGARNESSASGSTLNATGVFADMLEERTKVLDRLARSRALGASRWREALAQLDLASPGAEGELVGLRDAVERERVMWRDAVVQDESSGNLDTDLTLIATSLGVMAAWRGTYGALL